MTMNFLSAVTLTLTKRESNKIKKRIELFTERTSVKESV